MPSFFYWFTSCVISGMIHIWVISKLEVTLLEVFLHLFIWNLLFIISSSRNTLFNHRMLAKLKVSRSELTKLFLVKCFWFWRVVHVMKMRTWDFRRVIISKLEISVLKSSSHCLGICMMSSSLRGKFSLMNCHHRSALISKCEVSLSDIFIWSSSTLRFGLEFLICGIVSWDIMSGIIPIIEIMSSHFPLTILLLLKFLSCHVSWFSLVMNFMSRVIILRMVAKSKVRCS